MSLPEFIVGDPWLVDEGERELSGEPLGMDLMRMWRALKALDI